MALLQIAEPGKSAAPHQHRLAVGIDLGTTHSLVAAVQSGANRVLLDECGQALLPSVVRYHADASVTVGVNARARQSEDPHNTIVSVKRLMGRGLDDLSETARRPYRFSATPGMVRLDTVAGARTPVEVSAEILKSLRARAERTLGGELVGAVITVPAYFDDAQRQATKDAARLAGINVLRLLNEPTAAAVAYGLDHAAEGVFAIYDLGGGTFDISILRLSRGVFEVLATNGDSALGGDDFDQCIVDWLLAQTNSATPDARGARRLLAEARTAKEALTTQPQVDIVVPGASGTTQTIQLMRATFDEITRALVEKTLQPVRKALRDAGLKVLDIDATVLVGGSTRMPAVQAAVAAFFGKPPRTDLDPDQVVALGAAIQADALAGNRSDEWLLLDVIPLSLGLETLGGLTEKIIPRNSPIPAARAQDFTTYKDGQTALLVHVLQGERETVEHCRSLARFELRGIPPMTAGAARVRVTFQVDADGLLTVSARENRTGVEAVVAVKPSYGLNDDDIARMLADSQRHAQEDSEARALREQRVDSQQLLDMTQSALAADGARLLDARERAAIEQAMEALRNALAGSERDVLRTATEALNRASSEFAARRMNSAVRAALTGHKLAELEI